MKVYPEVGTRFHVTAQFQVKAKGITTDEGAAMSENSAKISNSLAGAVAK